MISNNGVRKTDRELNRSPLQYRIISQKVGEGKCKDKSTSFFLHIALRNDICFCKVPRDFDIRKNKRLFKKNH